MARKPGKRQNLMRDVDLMGGQQCTAISKQRRSRCRQPAIPGGTVCHYHGGAAPQVQEAARARLERLTHPAITRLGELVTQTEQPSTALAAVKDVLDRNGYGPVNAPAPRELQDRIVIVLQAAPPGQEARGLPIRSDGNGSHGR